MTNAVLDVARTGFSNLTLLPLDGHGEILLWACWSEAEPHRKASHLALIRRQGRSAKVMWSRRDDGAYDPVITQIYGALRPGMEAILLQYQTGADDAHASLLAVSAHGAVSVIGSVEGQTIDLLPSADNTIRASTGPADPPTCYGWSTDTDTLVRRSCR